MSHHATEDIAIMMSLPDMRVFVPADAREAKMIVHKAAELEAPCYIRLNKGGEPDIHPLSSKFEDYKIGQAIQLRKGQDICLMSTGAITIETVKAAQNLEHQGVEVAVYSFPSIKPIDNEVI